jgi:hypothetical protein
MSKHTKKVHGKLNFLMVAVVIMSGVMAVLLIRNGVIDFNPAELSAPVIKQLKGSQRLLSTITEVKFLSVLTVRRCKNF